MIMQVHIHTSASFPNVSLDSYTPDPVLHDTPLVPGAPHLMPTHTHWQGSSPLKPQSKQVEELGISRAARGIPRFSSSRREGHASGMYNKHHGKITCVATAALPPRTSGRSRKHQGVDGI